MAGAIDRHMGLALLGSVGKWNASPGAPFRRPPAVDRSPGHRYGAARPREAASSCPRGQELNIAHTAMARRPAGCPDFALFMLGKVTAGLSGNEGPHESSTFVGPEER